MGPDKIEKILIVDYGSQFTQLIARKIRELGVYSEIINPQNIKNIKKNKFLKGIVLSGGPLSITKNTGLKLNNLIIDLNLPLLGICYGHQILARKFGGKIKYTNDEVFSSSSIINSGNFLFNEDQKNFVNKIKKKFSYNQIYNLIQKILQKQT